MLVVLRFPLPHNYVIVSNVLFLYISGKHRTDDYNADMNSIFIHGIPGYVEKGVVRSMFERSGTSVLSLKPRYMQYQLLHVHCSCVDRLATCSDLLSGYCTRTFKHPKSGDLVLTAEWSNP